MRRLIPLPLRPHLLKRKHRKRASGAPGGQGSLQWPHLVVSAWLEAVLASCYDNGEGRARVLLAVQRLEVLVEPLDGPLGVGAVKEGTSGYQAVVGLNGHRPAISGGIEMPSLRQRARGFQRCHWPSWGLQPGNQESH